MNDLEAVIAHVGLDNPFVIGHSLGGLVATLYGARHPDCRGVVNLETPTKRRDTTHFLSSIGS
ncbi:hypothetical protein KDA_51290 [Dictyobacter alpinus]|uniref:AB hydrolase-1 domain-containing protein n=1 Tax=Dictyobacter alpinus TaxID=2014873 RepID=A0A402BE53_9CHLR|nr:hypothetical protein KDA_51290 [Dictyobacter alpinus]